MTVNVNGKLVALFIFGVVVGLALAVAPQHVHWDQPKPPAPPAPAPKPTPAPAPKPFPSTKDERKPFPSSWSPTVADAYPAHLCGWVPNHPSRPMVQASIPTLYQAAPQLTVDRSKSVLLYKVWKELWADYPDYPPQEIGDCESFGHGHAHDLLQTLEVYLGDLDISAVGRTCTEAAYAVGREAGNMLGYGDGCYGSAMLKGLTTMGVVRYGDLPADQRAYSGKRAKYWGQAGLPSDLRDIAAGRKLSGAMLSSTDDMIAALQAGHPCTISTRYGFTMTRDAQGFCKLKGHWGHCMGVVAYRADRPGFLVIQSWGPGQPEGPTDLDQPTWSFWSDEADITRIIAEGDCTTLSSSPGFAPRALPGVLQAA